MNTAREIVCVAFTEKVLIALHFKLASQNMRYANESVAQSAHLQHETIHTDTVVVTEHTSDSLNASTANSSISSWLLLYTRSLCTPAGIESHSAPFSVDYKMWTDNLHVENFRCLDDLTLIRNTTKFPWFI